MYKVLKQTTRFLLLGALSVACTEEVQPPAAFPSSSQSSTPPTTLQATPELVAAARTVSTVLGNLYEDPELFRLVNRAIAQEHYTDDRLPLKDLLQPDQSPVFQKLDKNARIDLSRFRERFRTELQAQRQRADRHARTQAYDEDYFIANGMTVYFPYSRGFKNKPTTSITVVASPAEDTNEAPGTEYSACGQQVCTKEVLVNDQYAETHPTHIVQAGGAEVARYKLSELPQTVPGARMKGGFMKTYIGFVRCAKQYDALVSLTGNGGGSEIKIARCSAYLRLDDDLQIRGPENVISVDITRDYIAHAIPIHVVAEWDQNWEEDDKEQFFAIYEDDTKGTAEYGGEISSTLKKKSDGSLFEGKAYVKVAVHTQDEIIVQHGWTRAPFLAGNNNDNGWGTVTPGFGVFGTDKWAVYDGPYVGFGGANVSYVMPHTFY